MIHKACPVALHPDGFPQRIACFAHPQAGLQLVKGTIEPGENPLRAATRELFEESGLETTAVIPFGDSLDIAAGQHWHFALCRVKPPVRESWQHLAPDDGGQLFRFFWQPLETELPDGFAQTYKRAFNCIKAAL